MGQNEVDMILNKDNGKCEQKKEEGKKNVPWRAITCPNCKYKGYGKDFLYNKELNYSVCKECGVLFMNVAVVKKVLLRVTSESEVVKNASGN